MSVETGSPFSNLIKDFLDGAEGSVPQEVVQEEQIRNTEELYRDAERRARQVEEARNSLFERRICELFEAAAEVLHTRDHLDTVVKLRMPDLEDPKDRTQVSLGFWWAEPSTSEIPRTTRFFNSFWCTPVSDLEGRFSRARVTGSQELIDLDPDVIGERLGGFLAEWKRRKAIRDVNGSKPQALRINPLLAHPPK